MLLPRQVRLTELFDNGGCFAIFYFVYCYLSINIFSFIILIPNNFFSDILFHNISYDQAQGDKFIQTCETLRPPCKTPRPISPFQFQQLRKPLPKLTWSDLAQALIQTYDVLIEADGLVGLTCCWR